MPGSRRKARGAHVVVVPVLTSTEVQVSSLWRSVRSQSLAVSILQEGSDLGGLGTRCRLPSRASRVGKWPQEASGGIWEASGRHRSCYYIRSTQAVLWPTVPCSATLYHIGDRRSHKDVQLPFPGFLDTFRISTSISFWTAEAPRHLGT